MHIKLCIFTLHHAQIIWLMFYLINLSITSKYNTILSHIWHSFWFVSNQNMYCSKCAHMLCSILNHIPHLPSSGTTGSVVLTLLQKYTVFQNNASAVFNCSGDGYAVGWYLNGSAYNAIYAQRGITVVPNPPTGTMTSSTLYIPSNSTNNNTEVFCKVADAYFTNVQTSELANLTIQGENTNNSIKITLFTDCMCR